MLVRQQHVTKTHTITSLRVVANLLNVTKNIDISNQPKKKTFLYKLCNCELSNCYMLENGATCTILTEENTILIKQKGGKLLLFIA